MPREARYWLGKLGPRRDTPKIKKSITRGFRGFLARHEQSVLQFPFSTSREKRELKGSNRKAWARESRS